MHLLHFKISYLSCLCLFGEHKRVTRFDPCDPWFVNQRAVRFWFLIISLWVWSGLGKDCVFDGWGDSNGKLVLCVVEFVNLGLNYEPIWCSSRLDYGQIDIELIGDVFELERTSKAPFLRRCFVLFLFVFCII